MRKRRNFKRLLLIFFLCLTTILVISCEKEVLVNLDRIELLEQPTLEYQAGNKMSDIRLKGGKIKAYFEDENVIERDIENAWYSALDFTLGKAVVTYQGKTLDVNIPGLTYVKTNEELLATQTEEHTLYVIKSGTYEITSLNYQRPIILIGEGDVVINFTAHASSQASIICQDNVTIYNMTINCQYNESLVFGLKIGKIGTSTDLPLTEKAAVEKVIVNGGKGINFVAVSDAYLSDSEIKIDETTKNVALSISSGTNLEVVKTKITHGTWGSVAIFGVDETSDKEFYKRKSSLSFSNCDISSAVYIEYFEVNKSVVKGLDDWKVVEQNNAKVYLKQE